MAGKFEVYADKGGDYRFRLKAGNGEIILSSEGYSSKAACMNGVESVKKNAADYARYEKKETASGKFMFNLKAANHQVIGSSQTYKSASGRDNGIESVKKNAVEAIVLEQHEIPKTSRNLDNGFSTRYLYLDNFRGFANALIPLKNVNFLVGENSTGKSSVLSVLKLLTSTSFWLNNSPGFDGAEVQFGSGSFQDLVSLNSSDKSFFSIAYHDKGGVRALPESRRIDTHLMVFTEKDGLPALTFYAYIYQGKAYFVRFGNREAKYKVSDNPFDSLEDDFQSLFSRWLDIYKTDKRGYKRLPNLFSSSVEMPIGLIPVLVQSSIGDDSSPSALTRIRTTVSMDSLIWLAPIRSKPKRTYDEYKLDFSPEGEHTPYLIKKLLGKKSDADSFDRFIKELGKSSGLFDSIKIQNYGKTQTSPFELDIVLNDKPLSINNVGYGVSQILPIIVELFTRQRGSSYAIQQPEVHLHPRAQASLGDIFYNLAAIETKRFLIETHSDFMIDRFRTNFKSGSTAHKPPSQILFFERQQTGNAVYQVEILDDGELSAEQPKSYRDFFIREQMSNLGLEL